MTLFATLCYIFRDGSVLLQKKSKGLFGEGKWNAPGGKLHDGESALDCVIREVSEETTLKISDPKLKGHLSFELVGSGVDQEVYVFSASGAEGEPVGGREGELKWFRIPDIPYDEMWEDDRYWVPVLLSGRSFSGRFVFQPQYTRLNGYSLSID